MAERRAVSGGRKGPVFSTSTRTTDFLESQGKTGGGLLSARVIAQNLLPFAAATSSRPRNP
eukprot:scaffold152736_cov24-Prasinocladus_malaysianus.AAC.1